MWQGCKMDCEKLRICEIANCDCEKIAISQLTQFIFLSAGRNRNITQFDFLEGRNCESCENYYIEKIFEKSIETGFQLISSNKNSQFSQLSQITRLDFEPILQPYES